jgi:peptide chain release factor subunit 1
VKTNRTRVGGWSQARYQRHVENFHQQHVKEVVEALDKLVREEKIERIIFAGNEVVIPLVQEQLPQHLAEKVVDVLRLDVRETEQQVLQATLEAMREHDARDDAERVQRMLDGYRSGGLGTAGLRETLRALEIGQVDELLLSAEPGAIRNGHDNGAEPVDAFTPDELVTRARQTGATVRFIEDPSLLEPVGGVGAMLRYRLEPAEAKRS